jgi:hypothetical protein
VRKSFVSTLLIFSLVLITGCGGGQSTQDSMSTSTSPQVEPSGGIDANYVCQDVGSLVSDYDEYLSLWRNEANNVPYEELFTVSDEISSSLYSIAEEVSNNGIDWDSGAIVAGAIANIANRIDEISTSTQEGFFPPGRDLNALLGDMNISANAVLNSACK